MTQLLLSELRQIFTKFVNFWQTNGQYDKTIKLCEFYLLSASHNLCQCTTM